MYDKRENVYFHEETTTGKRQKWRENQGHVVAFAVRVSHKLNVMRLGVAAPVNFDTLNSKSPQFGP